ncbi:MAG: entericidin A/B family lipoprotein [Parasphingorhabdus sp.]
MRKILVSMIISSTLLLAACNTVQGVGKDVESVGRAGEDAID